MLRNFAKVAKSHHVTSHGLNIDGDSEGDNITREMYQILPSDNSDLGQVAKHHFATPGKYIRAKIALRSSKYFQICPEVSIKWALAVELMHNASLIHDDICDKTSIRRGRINVRAKFGEQVALIFGDWLIGKSFEQANLAASKSHTTELSSILSFALIKTSLGQSRDLSYQTYPVWNEYLDIASEKTSPLLMLPAEGVFKIAQKNEFLEPLQILLTLLSKCYQIANDMKNIMGTDGEMAALSDLKRKAPNAVIIMFKESLNEKSQELFSKWIRESNNNDACYWQKQLNESQAFMKTSAVFKKMIDEVHLISTSLPEELRQITIPIMDDLKKEEY
jgi:geranylgeranyl pyrophosphate synthase